MDLIYFNLSTYIGGILAWILGAFSYTAVNRLPVKWLCDYNEIPGPRHLPPRVYLFPWGIAAGGAAGFFTACFNRLHTPSLWEVLCLLAILTILIQIAVIDVLYLIIPDQHIAALFITGALIRLPQLFSFNGNLLPSASDAFNVFYPLLAGSFICSGLPLLASILSFKLSGREAIGFGDIKLFAAVGFLLGPYGGLTMMASSFFLSGLIFSIRILKKEIGPKEEQPFGPYAAVCVTAYLLLNST